MRRFDVGFTVFDQAKKTSIPNQLHERYLLLYCYDGETFKTIENIRMALRYAKLPFDEMTFTQWRDTNISLNSYAQGAVIIIGERHDDLMHIERLKEYVTEKGGLLINVISCINSPLNSFFGIIGDGEYVFGVKGLRWKEKIYPGLSEQQLSSEDIYLSSFSLQLESSAQVWAESIESNHKIPYLWTMRRGKGKTLCWNIPLLNNKDYRAAFTQTMLKAQRCGAKLSIGALVLFLDDFPSPTFHSQNDSIGMTYYQFRRQYWGPDMQALSKKYGLRFSSGAIFSYNERVISPFEPFEFQKEGHEELFKQEAEQAYLNGELGFHGYNHFPLKLSYTKIQKNVLGYKPWPSTAVMRQALSTSRKLWQEYLKLPLPTMYIPASNVLSKEGKKALIKIFPELKTISSTYDSEEELASFQQEFLPDPDIPKLIGTPRITYGYLPTEQQRFVLYNGIGTLGVVSHFIHPDDALCNSRNMGKSWEELRDAYEEFIVNVLNRFPWLQSMTATELSDVLRYYHNAEVRIDLSRSDQITAFVSPLGGPVYLEAHVQQVDLWNVQQGGEIVERNEEYGLLWVKVNETKIVLSKGER